MSTIRITKEFRYEGAHALLGYDGKCRHIHGHSYLLCVTVTGRPINDSKNPKDGMVMDFSDLKRIVEKGIVEPFDHAIVMRNDSPLARDIAEEYGHVVLVDFQPTCENMISYFAEIIKRGLPEGVRLFSLKLYETATSYVEWFASDNME